MAEATSTASRQQAARSTRKHSARTPCRLSASKACVGKAALRKVGLRSFSTARTSRRELCRLGAPGQGAPYLVTTCVRPDKALRRLVCSLGWMPRCARGWRWATQPLLPRSQQQQQQQQLLLSAAASVICGYPCMTEIYLHFICAHYVVVVVAVMLSDNQNTITCFNITSSTTGWRGWRRAYARDC